jgi:DNA-binding response OmpR family regulator
MTAAISASLAAHPASAQHSMHSDVARETHLLAKVPDAADAVETPQPMPAAIAPEAADDDAKPATTAARRVYHLSDRNLLAREIRQRLEVDGYEIESLETVDDLSELMTCMSPQVLLVGATHMSDLTAVGAARRDTQQRSQHQERIQMVAMAEQDSVQLRLLARRAGVDVLLFPPFSAAEVLRQLQTLSTPAAEEKFRVLIVEDDHAQAMFAQSVLANAGMHAQVEHDPLHVMESLRSLHPDLVLMDLHMPHINGLQLTALIREHPSFMHTPIVFLSGESDPEARTAAINAGGDDFLCKPIRPKHLIAAVRDRLRDMRAAEKPAT